MKSINATTADILVLSAIRQCRAPQGRGPEVTNADDVCATVIPALAAPRRAQVAWEIARYHERVDIHGPHVIIAKPQLVRDLLAETPIDESIAPWAVTLTACLSDEPQRTDVTIDDEHFAWLLMRGVEYACGSATYIVSATCSIVRDHLEDLDTPTRTAISDLISERKDNAAKNGMILGMDFDHQQWVNLAADLDRQVA